MFYFDEELQEWVDDESGEVEVPLPPREELKYRNEPPSPPGFGLGGKYVMGKLPNDYVPEERPSDSLSMPSMLTPKNYGNAPDLLGDDTYDNTPIATAEAIGYGDRIITRKAGEENFTTLGGNVPMPDYFKSGGYRSKPDDPHGDSDVIYYPNEIHTKNQEGGWDIAQRNIPQKPDETKMTEFEFVQFARQKPEFKQAVEEAVKEYEKNFDYTDIALMRGPQKIAHEKDKARVAQSVAQRIEASLINEYRTMKRTAEEERKNLREKGEEEERFKRNQAAKDAAAAEKAEEREAVRAAKAEKDAQDRADRLAKASEAKSADLKWLEKTLDEKNTQALKEPADADMDPNTLETIQAIAKKNGKRVEKWYGKKSGVELPFGINIGREKYGYWKLVDDKEGAESSAEKTGETLDVSTARSILKEAGGDKAKARDIAKKRGYKF